MKPLNGWRRAHSCSTGESSDQPHRWHNGGQNDGVQHERFAHFGLGMAESIDKLTVYWPSGAVSEHTDLDIDTVHEVIEPNP